MGTYPPFGTGLAQGVELVKHRRYPYLDSKSAIWTEGLAKNQIKLDAVTSLPPLSRIILREPIEEREEASVY